MNLFEVNQLIHFVKSFCYIHNYVYGGL